MEKPGEEDGRQKRNEGKGKLLYPNTDLSIWLRTGSEVKEPVPGYLRYGKLRINLHKKVQGYRACMTVYYNWYKFEL
jgi:hypothetical protein